MRSDKDMAENILRKVNMMNEKKATRKNIITKTAAFALAFVMMATAGFALFNGNTPLAADHANDGTNTSETGNALNKNFCLIVANAATATETTLGKESNVSVPLGGILFVKDTRGMSDLDINKIPYELKVKLQTLYGTESGWKIHGESGETALYFGTMDHIRIKIDDPDSVEKITLSCTENGNLTVGDETLIASPGAYIQTVKTEKTIIVTGEEYKIVYAQNDGMTFDWFVSETLKETLKANPAMPLSEISDLITGTVTYTDGTQDSFTLTLTFDNDGNLTTRYAA